MTTAMGDPAAPIRALHQQRWCKVICGASFHHIPMIRNLALIYTLAGADCLDVAADPAIVHAAQAGIRAAQQVQPDIPAPWMMVSFHAGEDPHFRKAQRLTDCPSTCAQPCLSVCPPQALVRDPAQLSVQITQDLCYGCGRCQPICPPQILAMHSYPVVPEQVFPDLVALGIDAIEIHTHVGGQDDFAQVWQQLRPGIPTLKLVSISCGDGERLQDYFRDLLAIMDPPPPLLIWQTDGRPMSGDIGIGATRATVHLAAKVMEMGLPGYVQMAGGTNAHSAQKARELGIPVAGIAYGSYARQLVAEVADTGDLEQHPERLAHAVQLARSLVRTVKGE